MFLYGQAKRDEEGSGADVARAGLYHGREGGGGLPILRGIMSYGAFYSLYGFVCLDSAVGNGSYKFVMSVLVLFLRKKWDARRQAYRPLFGRSISKKSQVLCILNITPGSSTCFFVEECGNCMAVRPLL